MSQQKYNLSYHPSLTSSWRDFPFATHSLSDWIEEATYTKDEMFSIYALDGNHSNIKFETTLHFSMGRCFTLKPKVSTDIPVRLWTSSWSVSKEFYDWFQWKSSGYAITLNHDALESDAAETPGFHVYLHEPRETFTEHGILSTGRIDYIFMQANEEIELKLTVQQFTQLRGRGSTCSDDVRRSLSIVSVAIAIIEAWIKLENEFSAVRFAGGRQLKI